MNELEQQIADLFDDAIDAYEQAKPRTQQEVIGVSELGTCHEKTRRKLLQMEQTDVSKSGRAAFIGSAVGDVAEEAVLEHTMSTVWRQVEVSVDLPSGRWHLKGHVDLVLPHWGSGPDDLLGQLLVIDGKTKDGYEAVRRDGPTDQNHMQRNLYALGIYQAIQAGRLGFPSGATSELMRHQSIESYLVANAYIDRSGQEPKTLVNATPFSWDWVYAAETFLDDVVYAAEQGEEAAKDKPRNWCESFCEYYTACRLTDTDVAGLLTDQETVRAVELYAEGQELERQAKKMKEQARAALVGVRGNTATHSVRWTTTNASWVEGHMRKAGEKIEIRPLK